MSHECDALFTGPNCTIPWSDLPVYSLLEPFLIYGVPIPCLLMTVYFFYRSWLQYHDTRKVDIPSTLNFLAGLSTLSFGIYAALGYGVDLTFDNPWGLVASAAFIVNHTTRGTQVIIFLGFTRNTLMQQARQAYVSSERLMSQVRRMCVPFVLINLLQLSFLVSGVIPSPVVVVQVDHIISVLFMTWIGYQHYKYTLPLCQTLKASRDFAGRDSLIKRLYLHAYAFYVAYFLWTPFLVASGTTRILYNPYIFIIAMVYMLILTEVNVAVLVLLAVTWKRYRKRQGRPKVTPLTDRVTTNNSNLAKSPSKISQGFKTLSKTQQPSHGASGFADETSKLSSLIHN